MGVSGEVSGGLLNGVGQLGAVNSIDLSVFERITMVKVAVSFCFLSGFVFLH